MDTKIIRELIQKLRTENTDENVIGFSFGNKIVDNKFTNDLCITFYVRHKIHKDDVEPEFLIPNIIEYKGYRIPTDVNTGILEKLSNCPADFYTWETVPPPNQDLIPKLSGGTSTGNCTMGGLVIDNNDNSLVGLTCAHCAWWKNLNSVLNPFFPLNRQFNFTIIQGNDSESQVVGIQKNYTPCFNPPTSTLADAALFTVPRELIDFSSSYRQIGLTGWTQPMDFATTEEIDNLIFTKPNLYSSGRTTGAKGEGAMKLVCMASNFYFGNPGYATEDLVLFVASATTTPNGTSCPFPVNYGDSGSIVSADVGGVRKIIGLVAELFTSSGFTLAGVCRIDNIQNILNISPWTGQTNVNFSNSNTAFTETLTITSNFSDTHIVVDGKTYWQMGAQVPTQTPTLSPTPTPSQFSTPQPTASQTPPITPTRTQDPICTPLVNQSCYQWSLQFIENSSISFVNSMKAWATYNDCFNPTIVSLVEISVNSVSYVCSTTRPVVVSSRKLPNPAARGYIDIRDFVRITPIIVCGSLCVDVTPTPTPSPTNYLLYGVSIPALGSTSPEVACSNLNSGSAVIWGYTTKPLGELGAGDVIYDYETNLPKTSFANRYRAFSSTPDVVTPKYVVWWQNAGSTIASVNLCS